MGGTTRAVNAERIADEVLGTADGAPGATFALKRRPVLPSETPLVVEVTHTSSTGQSSDIYEIGVDVEVTP